MSIMPRSSVALGKNGNPPVVIAVFGSDATEPRRCSAIGLTLRTVVRQ